MPAGNFGIGVSVTQLLPVNIFEETNTFVGVSSKKLNSVDVVRNKTYGRNSK
jgi:hypothetical protein